MTESTKRCVVDEIVRDAEGEEIAVLVPDDGGTVTMPKRFLPEGTGLNDVIDLHLRRRPDETERRHRVVERLQHRLFHRSAEDPGRAERA